MNLGQVMIGLEGYQLSADEVKLIQYKQIGGVILFTRNFKNTQQLTELTQSIRKIKANILITVDHEGGRIQRFQEGFTALPSAAVVGRCYENDLEEGKTLAQAIGFMMASELHAVGIDINFAPVVDLEYGNSTVVNERCFHMSPEIVIECSKSLMMGMSEAGMLGIAKHFPGHGYVKADSHLELPIDQRSYEEIQVSDCRPYQALIENDLAGVMVAHIVYPSIDNKPASFSSLWLQDILRQELGFEGAIFTDDLGMKATESVGSMQERIRASIEAGADIAIVGNDSLAICPYIDQMPEPNEKSSSRLAKFLSHEALNLVQCRHTKRWQAAKQMCQEALAKFA